MGLAIPLALLAAAVAATAPADPRPPRVRLTAPPRVEIPGLYSGDGKTGSYREPAHRDGGLLIFDLGGGLREATLAPAASVTGVILGGDDASIQLLRDGKRAPDRVRRASVARVQVAAGRRRPVGKRALQGLGLGVGIGGAWMIGAAARTSAGLGDPENLGYIVLGAAFTGAVGATLGAVAGIAGETEWRDVPLDALAPLPSPARAPGSEPQAPGRP